MSTFFYLVRFSYSTALRFDDCLRLVDSFLEEIHFSTTFDDFSTTFRQLFDNFRQLSTIFRQLSTIFRQLFVDSKTIFEVKYVISVNQIYVSQAFAEIRHFRKCLGNSGNAWSSLNCLGISRNA